MIVKGGLNKAILYFGKFSIGCGSVIERRGFHSEHFEKTL